MENPFLEQNLFLFIPSKLNIIIHHRDVEHEVHPQFRIYVVVRIEPNKTRIIGEIIPLSENPFHLLYFYLPLTQIIGGILNELKNEWQKKE